MFHRKKRSASRQNALPSAPAQFAATQAFLASKSSSSNLSESAAAAALRALSPTPTPVSGVETKRMLQRQASTGSLGGADKALRRKSSAGSMTDRTFRTPSPNRLVHGSNLTDAPPVPPLPKTFNDDINHPRATSVEPSARLSSPPPSTKGGRVASLDRAQITRQRPQTQRQSRLPDGAELERSSSQNSVNFSYPTSARPSSPPMPNDVSASKNQSRLRTSQQLVEDTQDALNRAAAAPIRKKKQKASAEGRHLANGGMENKSPRSARDRSGDAEQSTLTPTRRAPRQAILAVNNHSDHSRGDFTNNAVDEALSSDDSTTVRRSQRVSGTLHKQPSVVREDWDGEQVDSPLPGDSVESHSRLRSERAASVLNGQNDKEALTPNSSRNMDETSSYAASNGVVAPRLVSDSSTSALRRQANLHLGSSLEVNEDAIRQSRQTSISPSRSTRFSAQLASEFSGRPLHEPPGRSVSPAKSALKHHSPSPQSLSSVDGVSSTRRKRVSQASSEASDNMSMASVDGSRTKSQTKKPTRVSFEEDARSLDEVMDDSGNDGSHLPVRYYKDPIKKLSAAKSHSRHLDSIPAEDEMEEFLKPRPVLPSFGSIRGRGEGSIEPSARPVESTSSSTSEASSTRNLARSEFSPSSPSYDRAVGKVISREYRAQQPAPRAPTSTAAGPASAMGEPESENNLKLPRAAGSEPQPAELVPAIAIQPATPGFESSDPQDEWLVEVPGSFPKYLDGETQSAVTLEDDVNIFEPSPQAVLAEDHRGGNFAHTYHEAESGSDSESTSSSIYSDAAEDQSDLEGDGFGSINSIVKNPINSTPMQSSMDADASLASNARREAVARQAQAGPRAKRGTASRSLARQQSNDDQAYDQSHDPVPPKTRARKRLAQKDKALSNEGLVLSSHIKPAARLSNASSRPNNKASPSGHGKMMKQSMRGQNEGGNDSAGLRSSMRQGRSSGLPNHDSTSTLTSGGALQKRAPLSPPNQRQPPSLTTKLGSGRPTGSGRPLTRQLSADSDSSSSFKKSRRPASSSGHATMRTSMRSGGDNGPKSQHTPPRRDVRSLSPPRQRPFSPKGDAQPRTTMRGASRGAAPSLRNQDQRKSTSNLSSMMKSRSKAKTSTPKSATSKFRSRFADSDDDEPGPRTFRSRFDNSSDEEGGASTLRPVRGIPRRPEVDDSTDLDDSSDDGGRKRSKQGQQTIQSPNTTNGSSKEPGWDANNPGVVQPTSPAASPKRKGLFSRFRTKKADDPGSPAFPNSAEPDSGDRHPSGQLPAQSPQITSFPDSKGKLQRKHTPQRMDSGSWPPPPTSAEDGDRPQTSDDTQSLSRPNRRPGIANRQNTTSTLGAEGKSFTVEETGRKKRFPMMLRKAFRL